jgi:hypothetical protein
MGARRPVRRWTALLATLSVAVLIAYGAAWARFHWASPAAASASIGIDEGLDPGAAAALRQMREPVGALMQACVELDGGGTTSLEQALRADFGDAQFRGVAAALDASTPAVQALWLALDAGSPSTPRTVVGPGASPTRASEPSHSSLLHELSRASMVLAADAVAAAERGDAARCGVTLHAAARLAQMSVHGRGFLYSLAHAGLTVHVARATSWVLTHHPDMLSDADVRKIAAELGTLGEAVHVDVAGEREGLRRLFKEFFTATSWDGGRITPAGYALLKSRGGAQPLRPMRGRDLLPRSPLEWLDPLRALRVASRREDDLAMDEMLGATATLATTPMHRWTATTVDIATRGHDPERWLMTGTLRDLTLIAAKSRTAVMHRDGALVAIALELYRREHGEWPASLAALVPMYLPQVPMDEFSGSPMRYEVRDGGPWVWGVGGDMDDDGGARPAERYNDDLVARWYGVGNTSDLTPKDGDWILFPAR